MSDLGSKTALNADVDAKVTTNGTNANTGARVNDCLNNIVDTVYANGGAHKGVYQAGLNLNYRDTVAHLDQLWEWQLTETTSTNWGADSANFLLIASKVADAIADGVTHIGPSQNAVFDALAGKADLTCRVYAFLATQSGTDAPVINVLQNDLGGNVVWTRDNTGTYTGTLNGAFTVNKTLIITQCASTAIEIGNGTLKDFSRVSADAIQINTLDGGSDSDDLLSNTPFKLEVYL